MARRKQHLTRRAASAEPYVELTSIKLSPSDTHMTRVRILAEALRQELLRFAARLGQ